MFCYVYSGFVNITREYIVYECKCVRVCIRVYVLMRVCNYCVGV